jgi:hypothetical protein
MVELYFGDHPQIGSGRCDSISETVNEGERFRGPVVDDS